MHIALRIQLMQDGQLAHAKQQSSCVSNCFRLSCCCSVVQLRVSQASIAVTCMSMTHTGVTMQTSAKRAKFPGVYEWLQVGRLERYLR